MRAAIEGAAAGKLSVAVDRAQAAPPQSGAAVHDLDAAAGSGAQARLRRAAHDAPRAAAVRRRRLRRRRSRPHHLHAHGLVEPRERSDAGDPPGHRRELTAPESLPEAPRVYKTKSKNAQEAHEAIRPTSAAITPERLEGKIDPDQFKLYSLIWKRAVASQMEPAVYDTVAVDLVPGHRCEARRRRRGAARQRLDAREARLHRRI